jgi:hypothetical protein
VANCSEVLLPKYALKEFKAGPLRGYTWFHNKVISSDTWADAVRAIPTVMRQKNLAATALGALADFESSISNQLLTELAARHPNDTLESIKRKEARAFLRKKVLLAWRMARKAPYQPVEVLPCFAEAAPHLNSDGTLENKPMTCTLGDCCLVEALSKVKPVATALRDVCHTLRAKKEMGKRKKVLDKIIRSASVKLTENECRALGDAVFSLQCPAGAVILTTNIDDHEPLAKSVGKQVRDPASLVAAPSNG